MTDDASPTSRLRRIGETLYGSQWQTELARALQLSDARRVRQWLTGERGIPETIWGELRELLKRRRDEATALLRSWL